MAFTTLFATVGILVAAIVFNGIHSVSEGHVGVYWRGGRLLDRMTNPGWHVKIPMLERMEEVQTTMQTDSVMDIPCGTSGGVLVFFDRIEVVNRLRSGHVLDTIREYGVNYDKMWIFDKIHHEINQFCSKHSLREVFIDLFDTLDENLLKAIQEDCDRHKTGIEIINVRVTKPRIPEQIRKSYEMIETEKTALLLAAERQKIVEKDAETEANRAKIQARMQKEVRSIQIEKDILEKEGYRRMRAIEAEIHTNTEKSKADAALYAAKLEAESNQLKLTPAFLKHQLLLSLSNVSKVYFGESIPKMLIDGANGMGTAFAAIDQAAHSAFGTSAGDENAKKKKKVQE